MPLTKMGSRASCVSLAHRHSRAMPPVRLARRRSVVGPSPPRSQIPLSGCAFVRLQAAHGIRPISLTLRQNSPGKTCHLVGYGDRRDVHMRSPLQSVCPSRYWRRPITHEMQHRSSSVDEELTQISVTVFRDSDQLGLATCRDLPRHQTKPCGKITTFAKRAVSAVTAARLFSLTGSSSMAGARRSCWRGDRRRWLRGSP